MTDLKSTYFYFWCCLVQSAVIIGLAFYAGHEKSDKEELLQENERNAFTLTVREAEPSRLNAILDTCYGGKK